MSGNYDKVCEANKIYYSQTAAQYDATETCVVDPRFQQVLEQDLQRIAALVKEARATSTIEVLDACGGSGNVSLKLARIDGVHVTLCDQSPELIDIFRRKCASQGSSCNVVNQEINAYLASTDKKFDLIVFSSALHHLEDYVSVLKLAAAHLNENGFIFTVFDPIKWKFPARQIVLAEYAFFKMAQGSFFPALKKKLLRPFSKGQGNVNWGKLAEYHVDEGIDDFDLVRRLQEHGLAVIWHIREPKARYGFFECILKLCGCATTFKLLLQKTGPKGS